MAFPSILFFSTRCRFRSSFSQRLRLNQRLNTHFTVNSTIASETSALVISCVRFGKWIDFSSPKSPRGTTLPKDSPVIHVLSNRSAAK